MTETCRECGSEMVEKEGQSIEDVEIHRHYCSDCGVIRHQFEITSDKPLQDAKTLLGGQ